VLQAINKITVIRQEGVVNNNYPFAADIHYFERPIPTRLPSHLMSAAATEIEQYGDDELNDKSNRDKVMHKNSRKLTHRSHGNKLDDRYGAILKICWE
jgi:hypothetical protein